MAGCHRIIRSVLPAFAALVVVAGVAYHVSMRRSLFVALNRLSPGMSIEDVRASIPARFFDEEGIASNSLYLADRVFQNDATATRFLTYSQTRGDLTADAQVFFDRDSTLIGFSYTADGFPQLRQDRTDGVGPRGARTFIRGTAVR